MLLAALCAAAAGFVLVSGAASLPPQVALHFDAAGQPDAWAGRPVYLALMGGLSAGVPALVGSVFLLPRWLPAPMVRLPHREHWLAAPQRAATWTALATLGLWAAACFAVFLCALHALVIRAHGATPVYLPVGDVLGAVAGLAAGLALGGLALALRFGRVPSA